MNEEKALDIIRDLDFSIGTMELLYSYLNELIARAYPGEYDTYRERVMEPVFNIQHTMNSARDYINDTWKRDVDLILRQEKPEEQAQPTA